MAAVKAVRNRRSEMNVPPSRKAAVHIATSYQETFGAAKAVVERLCSASQVEIGNAWAVDNAVSIVTADAKIYIPMGELVDLQAERERLGKELENAKKQLLGIENKLQNQNFVRKAPANVVEDQRQKAAKLQEKISMIEEGIKSLG